MNVVVEGSPPPTAKNAWICLFAQLILIVVVNEGLEIAYQSSQGSAEWLLAHLNLMDILLMIVGDFYWVGTAYLCSQRGSLSEFARTVGLLRFPGRDAIVVVGLALGFGLGLLLLARHTAGPGNPLASHFQRGGTARWAFFVVYSTTATPLVEELALRGFVYRAFRRSYGLLLSTVIVVSVGLLLHWQMVTESIPAMALSASFALAECLIVERTANTWNCVLFHAIYNGIAAVA